jgi:hypothetical protein
MEHNGETETALSARANQLGYQLRKSRRLGDPFDNFGGYMLVDGATTRIVLGSRYDANLDDIAAFLS